VGFSPRSDLSFDLVGQRTDLQNMIAAQTVALATENSSARYSYVNIDQAWTQSVDATAAWKVHERLELEGRGGWLQTRDVSRDRPLSGRPPATAGLGTRVFSPGDRFRLDTTYSWQAPATFYVDRDGDGTDESFEAPAWHMVDARVAGKVGSRVELHVGADNLLDTGDLQYAVTRPRRVYGGLTVSASKGGADASR
jgi:outer membrane receptor for ferrienterochelin and colicin